MIPTIQTLPIDVVHLIAAGEVIDSLAAVVRELVENALDANATRIHVVLDPDCWRVRVTDNGAGMSLDDLRSAASPHSTSKIQNRDDLWKITSLGFRGEALHSLAQLANLEICSQQTDAEAGWRVCYDSTGQPIHTETVAIAPGTIVTAHDVFGGWAARRQGLPSLNQQLRSVQSTIQHLALCHPHVTWTVEQGDRPWFSIWSGGTAKDILPQLIRDVQVSDVQELVISPATEEQTTQPADDFHSLTAPSLYLLVGRPDRCHRHRTDWICVAINGRIVRSPELEQTIMGAFRRTLPRDRHPVCFVHLRVHSNQVDWNRHPAKTDVYLHEMERWRIQVTNAIHQALRLDPTNLSDTAHSNRIGQVIKVAEATGAYRTSRSISEPSDGASTRESDSSSPVNSPALHTSLKAIAQVHQMYILAEHPTGMWLIEQHIAHERVIYEQLCDRWHVVPIETPIILNQLLPAQVDQLRRLNLDVDEFGDHLWAVRSVPASLAQRDDRADALIELSLGGDLNAALVATACRTAIRNGIPLNQIEMQTLINQWQQTRNPSTCPHGRPIYLSLEESSLSRFFRRHWVIGKSHGI